MAIDRGERRRIARAYSRVAGREAGREQLNKAFNEANKKAWHRSSIEARLFFTHTATQALTQDPARNSMRRFRARPSVVSFDAIG
jgi:hypothetical protein